MVCIKEHAFKIVCHRKALMYPSIPSLGNGNASSGGKTRFQHAPQCADENELLPCLNAKTTKFWNPFLKGCRQQRFAFRHGAFFKLCFYRCPVRRVFSDGHSLVTSLFLQDQLGVGGRILALE